MGGPRKVSKRDGQERYQRTKCAPTAGICQHNGSNGYHNAEKTVHGHIKTDTTEKNETDRFSVAMSLESKLLLGWALGGGSRVAPTPRACPLQHGVCPTYKAFFLPGMQEPVQVLQVHGEQEGGGEGPGWSLGRVPPVLEVVRRLRGGVAQEGVGKDD